MPESLTRKKKTPPTTARVADFKSEWWPDLFRNGGRLQIGIPAGFTSEHPAGLNRNPQRENLERNIRLSDMARECGLSVSHFTRTFRKSFGMSPCRWLLERRIDRSKELLVTSDLPIADIAIRSGYSDQTAFTRAFGRVVGDSPGRWRRAVTSR